MDIDNMQAGHDMDVLVAERIMGWVWINNGERASFDPPASSAKMRAVYPEYVPGRPDGLEMYDDSDTPRFSCEMNAAMRVVEVMQRYGRWCEMRTPFGAPGSKDDDGYWCGFTPHLTTGWNGVPDHHTSAPTMPLAICRAALKAMEELAELAQSAVSESEGL